MSKRCFSYIILHYFKNGLTPFLFECTRAHKYAHSLVHTHRRYGFSIICTEGLCPNRLLSTEKASILKKTITRTNTRTRKLADTRTHTQTGNVRIGACVKAQRGQEFAYCVAADSHNQWSRHCGFRPTTSSGSTAGSVCSFCRYFLLRRLHICTSLIPRYY